MNQKYELYPQVTIEPSLKDIVLDTWKMKAVKCIQEHTLDQDRFSILKSPVLQGDRLHELGIYAIRHSQDWKLYFDLTQSDHHQDVFVVDLNEAEIQDESLLLEKLHSVDGFLDSHVRGPLQYVSAIEASIMSLIYQYETTDTEPHPYLIDSVQFNEDMVDYQLLLDLAKGCLLIVKQGPEDDSHLGQVINQFDINHVTQAARMWVWDYILETKEE